MGRTKRACMRKNTGGKAPRKTLATKAVRKNASAIGMDLSSLMPSFSDTSSVNSNNNDEYDQQCTMGGRTKRACMRKNTGMKAPRKQLATKAARKSAPVIRMDLSCLMHDHDQNESMDELDDIVSEVGSFTLESEEEEYYWTNKVSTLEEKQRRSPSKTYKFSLCDEAKAQDLIDLANQMTAKAAELKVAATEMMEEEEKMKKFKLPVIVERMLDKATMQQLTTSDTAENAAAYAMKIILRHVDIEKTYMKSWVSGFHCGCQEEEEEYGRGECPCRDWDCDGQCDHPHRKTSMNCSCKEDMLEEYFEEGPPKGYLAAAVYFPAKKMLKYSLRQEEALRVPLIKGCRSALQAFVDDLERTPKNMFAIKTIKLLIAFLNDSEGLDMSKEEVIEVLD
eukprot:scaffold107022_cov52-Attheya_sp.AAC.1